MTRDLGTLKPAYGLPSDLEGIRLNEGSPDVIDRIGAGMGDMIIAADIVRQFPERGFLIYATRGTKKFLDGLGGRESDTGVSRTGIFKPTTIDTTSEHGVEHVESVINCTAQQLPDVAFILPKQNVALFIRT